MICLRPLRPVSGDDLPAAVRPEARLLELVRGLPEADEGVEIMVDCEPPGLALTPERADRVARCSRHLLNAALASPRTRAADLCVRADLRSDVPMLYLSARSVQDGAGAGSSAASRPLIQRERSMVRGAGKAILLGRREGAENRVTLALEMPFEVEPEAPSRVGSAVRVVVADDNPRVRRVARRLLERRGFEVVESTGAIALLGELDPQRPGPAPDWVLVDEGWLRPADGAGHGLLTAIEARVPAERIVLLSGRRCRFGSRHRRLAKPFSGDELQASLADDSVPERNAEAERPYSLSL